jgi:hypothetical protein
MFFLNVIPAISVLLFGAALYIWLCLRFPPALFFGVAAYSMISKSASVVYLETVRSFIIETGMVSGAVGASIRHIVYNLIIFFTALIVLRAFIAKNNLHIYRKASGFGSKSYDKELRTALILASVLLSVQIFNALLSPPYAIPGLGVNRQQFWDNIRSKFVADLLGVLVIYVPAISGLAIAYAKVTNNRYFTTFGMRLIVVYIFYFIITGARFNGSLLALLFWLPSYWSVLWFFGRSLQIKRMSLLISIALPVFVFVGYLEIADRGIADLQGGAWEGLLYRVFVLQGDVYYAADVLAGQGARHSADLLINDMETTIRAYMPGRLASAYIFKGVNLAGSMPGNSIFVYGFWLGVIPMAIYGAILGLVVSLFAYFILSGRFVLVIPGSYLCLWTYGGYTQGSFSFLLNYKFPLFISLIVVWLLLPRFKARRQSSIYRRQGVAR